jgi:hypothetical protein
MQNVSRQLARVVELGTVARIRQDNQGARRYRIVQALTSVHGDDAVFSAMDDQQRTSDAVGVVTRGGLECDRAGIGEQSAKCA